MEARVSYALVGLFVVVMGSIMIILSLWLITAGPTGETRTFQVDMRESVAGLSTVSAVKYQGVHVGRVSAIELDRHRPGSVRILFEVHPDTPVTRDTMASLGAQGLTGLAHLELSGGGPDSLPLEAALGEPYPRIPTKTSLMARLESDGLDLLDRLRDLSDDLGATLALTRDLLSDDNRAAVAAILSNTSRLSERLAAGAERLEQRIDALDPLLEHSTRFAEGLPVLAERAEDTLGQAERALGEITRVAQGVDTLVAAATPAVTELRRDGLSQVGPLIGDLRSLVDHLERLASELEREPEQLIYGRARRRGPGE